MAATLGKVTAEVLVRMKGSETLIPVGTIEMDVEVTPQADPHDHRPVQHRDGKEAWCNTCGLNAYHAEPRSRLGR